MRNKILISWIEKDQKRPHVFVNVLHYTMFFTHQAGGSHRKGVKQRMEFLRENPFDLNSTEAPPQKRHVSSSDEFAGSSELCCLSEGFSWKP